MDDTVTVSHDDCAYIEPEIERAREALHNVEERANRLATLEDSRSAHRLTLEALRAHAAVVQLRGPLHALLREARR